MTPGKMLLLNGASSSGKSSVARELQGLLVEPYLHPGIDNFLALFPGRYFGELPPADEGFLLVKADCRRRTREANQTTLRLYPQPEHAGPLEVVRKESSRMSAIHQPGRSQMQTGTHPIGVFNEWGKLQEVLVGDCTRFTFPRWSPDWGRYHGFKEMLKGLEGVPLSQAYPERAKGAIEQTEALVGLLEKHGVTVHRPRLLTDEEIASNPVGLASQYARDPQVVIGNHVIETNLRLICRNKEHLGYEQFFRERLARDPGARHVRMPDTTPVLSGETEEDFLNDPRPFLEGGDTFLLGKDILVGFSSLGSSPAGVAWLQRYLGDEGYRVHIVPLTTEWLHLDCMFAVIREGLCMCYRGGLKEGRLPAPIKDWEVIEATADEAHALGCNTLCLEPGVVIIGAEHPRLIKEIEKRGGTVIPVPFDKPSELGGGIRCSTHPLVRAV